jgi:hypothetical protein
MSTSILFLVGVVSLVVVLGIFAALSRIASPPDSGIEAEESQRIGVSGSISSDDENLGSIEGMKIRIPRQMPHRSWFIEDGIETIDQLRSLHALRDVYGIGETRSANVYSWFEENDLHKGLPDRLAPETGEGSEVEEEAPANSL